MNLICFTVLFTLATVTFCKEKTFYEVLEVPNSASPKEIKKSFRNLALQYHPDKNPDADPNIFMKIKDAYDVLSDKEKRQQYDAVGHDRYVNNGGQGGGGGHYHHHFKPGDFHAHFQSFDDLFSDFDDDFDSFFAGHHGHQHHQANFRTFGGEFLDLDEMFSDNLGGNHFGSQDSFFGPGGHFQHEDHMRRHKEAHNQAHHHAHGNHAHHVHNTQSGHYRMNAHSNGRSCKTVTQKVGNVVTTYTTCS